MWCRSVAKISVMPSIVRKLPRMMPCWPCVGSTVVTKPKPSCCATTEPATCNAEMVSRAVRPSTTPTSNSCASAITTGPGMRRSIAYSARCSGNRTAASSSATVRRMRTGTLSSPRPGSSITIVPMRANSSMKAAAYAGRNERSTRMRVRPQWVTRRMIRAASRIICPCSTSPMNGSAISIATKIARIFGTNTRVISWIWVSACTSEIATPTASPTSISGPPR